MGFSGLSQSTLIMGRIRDASEKLVDQVCLTTEFSGLGLKF